jgi:hypothetical protein
MTPDKSTEHATDSTVDDWLGQEVAKDDEIADEVVAEAGGDMDEAERLFNERSHRNDPEAVPAVPESDRP